MNRTMQAGLTIITMCLMAGALSWAFDFGPALGLLFGLLWGFLVVTPISYWVYSR